MDEDVRIISTSEELDAISDPFRLSILNVFRENETPLTVKKCADILGEFPAKIHYHVKKLLNVNILVLDHIEVINGINAKYYRMPQKQLKIELSIDTEDTVQSNIDYVNNIMISKIEQFKVDFITMSQTAMTKKENSLYDIGWFSLNDVFLTEDEFDEFESFLKQFVLSHMKKDNGKREYSLFAGIANKAKK